MGGSYDFRPVMAMVGLQFSYAVLALTSRAALLQGMSPRVFVVYRQAIATLVISPLAYFSRNSTNSSLSLGSFSWIFLAALIGVAINQNIYFEGMYLASSSMASAMGNLIPGITFVMTCILGLEKDEFGSRRSIAKIVGTIMCVTGAVSMALLKGSKLLNAESFPATSLFGSADEDWLLGCLLLFGSCCCWSTWLILQVPASASCPDLLTLSAWMCFFATLQSAIIAFFTEPDPKAWKISSTFELGCCFFSGIIGSAVSYYVQGWCILRKGPLFCAMFNPLCTVIVLIFAAIFLHEEIYVGSLLGAIGVIAGLYIVLWGKAKDVIEINEDTKLQKDEVRNRKVMMDDSSVETNCRIDLEEPLLSNKSSNVDESRICH